MRGFGVFCCLALSCLAWADAGGWSLPVWESVDRRLLYRHFSHKALGGGYTLQLGDTEDARNGATTSAQMLVGNRARWRARIKYPVGADVGGLVQTTLFYPTLRYEAHTPDAVILRCFVRGELRRSAEMSLALRLSDGRPLWTGDPVSCTTERVGGPTLHQGHLLYESYYSPSNMPVIVCRSDLTGKVQFQVELPSPERNPADSDVPIYSQLLDRSVHAIRARPEGLQVDVSDQLRNWQRFTLSALDGTARSVTSGKSRPGKALFKS